MLVGVGKFRITWADTGRGDLKTGKFDRVLAKHKLVWVEGDAVMSTDVKPINRLVEAISQGAGPEEGVMDDFCLVWHV